MIELTRIIHYLRISRLPRSGGFSIHIFRSLDEALRSWTQSSRVSPLFLVLNSPKQSPDLQNFGVFFFGPAYPSRQIPVAPSYLTLGAFNQVFLGSPKSSDITLLKKYTSDHCIPWEHWTIVGNHLTSTESSRQTQATLPPTGQPKTVPKLSFANASKAAAQEYATTLAEAQARLPYILTKASADLAQFDKFFRRLLVDKNIQPLIKHGLIVNANGALSHFLAQCLTGISPIIENECPIWDHSLLGIGVASRALFNIKTFLQDTISEPGLLESIAMLKKSSGFPRSLPAYTYAEPEWKLLQEALKSHHRTWQSNPENQNKKSIKSEIFTRLTCFSGRDGFRSTKISLSAPLESVSSSNTTTWSLLTLTHEVSHIMVDGALGLLLPNPENEEDLGRTIKDILRQDNLFQQVQAYLIFAICRLQNLRPSSTDRRGSYSSPEQGGIAASEIATTIRQAWAELNELLAHCIDFLYFYQGNLDLYVESIWVSWASIPNIRQRLYEYLTRTVCAAMAENLQREEYIYSSMDQALGSLRKVGKKYKKLFFINEALKILADEISLKQQAPAACSSAEESLEKRLMMRRDIVNFAKTVLFNKAVAQQMLQEKVVTSGPDRYNFQTSKFQEQRISNPLKFLETYSRNAQPNTQKSLWLLTQLAFME